MKTNRNSYLSSVDSYKLSHWLQYPYGMTSCFSYIESRKGSLYPNTAFFGLQYYLKEYLLHRVTAEEIEEFAVFAAKHGLPFNKEGWLYIANDLKGKLPVRIRAVPEGTIVPINNALVTIESTDSKVPWVVSWLETSLLRAIWYPTTVCTRSWAIKQTILEALNKSSDDPKSEIDFKLHSFGDRGVSSQESAMIGDAAHLVNFKGSDTIEGVMCANHYYNCEMSAWSIPASEHSSITSWGKENEGLAYKNMLDKFAKPGAIVACVSDSYDIYNACEKLWGTELKQQIINSGATLVVRPDSGEPKEVVLKVLQILDSKFDHTINSKGYKVLNHVRIIQGDGVNENSIKEILDIVLENGFSATNVNFGCGGYLLQQLNRDDQKFAMKCSSITVNNEERDVFKNPVTDQGKSSKAGRLDLVKLANGHFETIRLLNGQVANEFSVMRTVYQNGELLVDDLLETIKNRSLNN